MATQNSCDNDINVTSLNPINITSADDITLSSSNLIDIAGTNGTTIQDNTSITFTSDGTISATSAGTFDIVSNAGVVAGIGIGANGVDPATTLQIGCANGTGDEAVLVYAEGGGITHQAATNINLTSTNNTIITATGNFEATSAGTTNLISNDSTVAAMAIAANGVGAGTTLQIGCPNGTGDEAVLVYAEAGGITLDATTLVSLIANNGLVNVSASDVVQIQSTDSTSSSAISLTAASGGITMTANGVMDLTSSGTTNILSNDSAVAAMSIGANGVGTNTTLQIGCANGTSDEAVLIYAEAGGVTLQAATAVSIYNGAQKFEILTGSGSPQGVVTAVEGSIYSDVSGGGANNLYTNGDGTNTGWYNIVGTKDPGGAGFTWTVNPSAAAGPFTLVPNNGYFSEDSTTTVQYNLPLTSAVGDTYSVFSLAPITFSPSWQINQNAGQTIQWGSLYTVTGVGHGLQTFNTNNGTGVTLVCTAANTDWIITANQGTSFSFF